MHKVNRRNLLASLGTLSGSALLTGCGMQFPTEPKVQADELGARTVSQTSPAAAWEYIKLDPELVGERAYGSYPEGGCMFAVVGSVIGTLADQFGEPFRSFPVEMMRYGRSGVGSWGSLCGIVNGGSALIGLFHNEKDREARDEMIGEFCNWYETTCLPVYEPAKPQWADEADPSVAGSVLCHISTAKWCEKAGCDAYCVEKKERCQRLAADGAMKIVEILNRKAEDPACEFAKLTSEVKSCIDCHGKRELADAAGKMNCGSCHQFDKEHP
jgi:putative redox-active protein with C_GCAxxG_C_C motif